MGQLSIFTVEDRYAAISKCGDPLEKLAKDDHSIVSDLGLQAVLPIPLMSFDMGNPGGAK
jgi:hypothetical protein